MSPEFDEDIEIDLGEIETEAVADEVEVDLSSEEEPIAEPDIDVNFAEGDSAEEEKAEETEDLSDSEALQKALEELREELEGKFGDWYVVHTYSGMENRVKQNIDARAATLDMEDYIFETIVPTEEVIEVRNNARKAVTRCVLPGYVLVRMDLTDDSWGVVRHTPSVTGFVGNGQTAVPLAIEDVIKMLTPSVKARVAAEQTAATPKQLKRKVEVVDFKVGDSVMVTDGAFTGIHATITEINANTSRLRALVEILGRETPVDLEFRQVTKVV